MDTNSNADKNMGHPATPSTTVHYLTQFSKNVGEWAARNFDTSSKTHSILGLMEEVGELMKFSRISPLGQMVAKMHHHVLKDAQGIRGDGHKTDFEDLAGKLYDTVLHIDMWECRNAFYEVNENIEIEHKGKTLTLEEAEEQRKDAVGDILIYLADFCHRNGYDMGAIAEKTWAKVSKRDWVANPNDAAEKAGDD